MIKKTLRKRNKVINSKNKLSIKHKRIKRKHKLFTRKQLGGLLFNLNKWNISLANPQPINNFKQLTQGVIIFKVDTKSKKPDLKNPYIILDETMEYTAPKQKKQIRLIIQLIKPLTSGYFSNKVSNLTGTSTLTGSTGLPIILSQDEFNNWFYSKNSLPIDPTKKPEFSELNDDPQQSLLKLNDNLLSPFPIVYNQSPQKNFTPFTVSQHLSSVAGAVQSASLELSSYLSDTLNPSNQLNKEKVEIHNELINTATSILNSKTGKIKRTAQAVRRISKGILLPEEFPTSLVIANKAVSGEFSKKIQGKIATLQGVAKSAPQSKRASIEAEINNLISNSIKDLINNDIENAARNNLNETPNINGSIRAVQNVTSPGGAEYNALRDAATKYLSTNQNLIAAIKAVKNITSPGGAEYKALRDAATTSLTSNQGGIERAAKAAQDEALNNQYRVIYDAVDVLPEIQLASKVDAINKSEELMKDEKEKLFQVMKDEISDREPFKTQAKDAAINAMEAEATSQSATIGSSLTNSPNVQQNGIQGIGRDLSQWINAHPEFNITPELSAQIVSSIADADTTDQAITNAISAYDKSKTVTNRIASAKEALTNEVTRLRNLHVPPADAISFINEMLVQAKTADNYKNAIENVKNFLQSAKINADLITNIIAAGNNAGELIIDKQINTDITEIINAGKGAANLNAALLAMDAAATNFSRATIDNIINVAKKVGEPIIKNKVDEIINKIYNESVKANTIPNVALNASGVITNDLVIPLTTALGGAPIVGQITDAAAAINSAALTAGGNAPSQQQIDDLTVEIGKKIVESASKGKTVQEASTNAVTEASSEGVAEVSAQNIGLVATNAAATATPTQQEVDDAAANIGKKIVEAASKGKTVDEIARNVESAAIDAGVLAPAPVAISSAAKSVPVPTNKEIYNEADNIRNKIFEAASTGKSVAEVGFKAQSAAKDAGISDNVALAIKDYAVSIGNNNPSANEINDEGTFIITNIVNAVSQGKTVEEASKNAQTVAIREGLKGSIATDVIPNLVLKFGNTSSNNTDSTSNNTGEFIMENLFTNDPSIIPLKKITDTFKLDQIYFRNETLDTRISCLNLATEYLYIYNAAQLSEKITVTDLQQKIGFMNKLIINDKINRLNQQATLLSSILPTGSGELYEKIANDTKFIQVKLNYLNELIYFVSTLNYNITLQTIIQRPFALPQNIIDNINLITKDKFNELETKAHDSAMKILDLSDSTGQNGVSTGQNGVSTGQNGVSTNSKLDIHGDNSTELNSELDVQPQPVSPGNLGSGSDSGSNSGSDSGSDSKNLNESIIKVKVRVPPNKKEGDKINFRYKDHHYEAIIPPNANSGQFFEVHINPPPAQLVPAASEPISPISEKVDSNLEPISTPENIDSNLEPISASENIDSNLEPISASENIDSNLDYSSAPENNVSDSKPLSQESIPLQLKVKVPTNKMAGEKMKFSYLNKPYEIIVPKDVIAGEDIRFSINIPAPESVEEVSDPNIAPETQVVPENNVIPDKNPSFEVNSSELNQIVAQVGDKYSQTIPKMTSSFITILETMLKTEQDPVKQDNIKTAIASLKDNNNNFEKLNQQLNDIFKDAKGGPSFEGNVTNLLSLFNKAQTAQKVEEMDAIASVLAAMAAGVMLVGGNHNKTIKKKLNNMFKTRRNRLSRIVS